MRYRVSNCRSTWDYKISKGLVYCVKKKILNLFWWNVQGGLSFKQAITLSDNLNLIDKLSSEETTCLKH